jgi:hypothetical protein
MTEQLLDHNPTDYEFDPNDLDPSDFDDFDAPTDDITAEDAFKSFFLDPEQTAVAREAEKMPSIDEDQYQAWLASLPEDRHQLLEGERNRYLAERDRRNAIHDKLTSLVPELYEAKLPPELEQKLGGQRYALGFNQTMNNRDVVGATAYLKENQGVDFTGYRLGHRFLIYDESMTNEQLGTDNPKGIARAIEAGYFNDTTVGRLVAAFPVQEGVEITQGRLATEVSLHPEDVLPHDAQVAASHGVSYAGKYVAGFIDAGGNFWVNQEFTVSNDPNFVPYERPPDASTDDFM